MNRTMLSGTLLAAFVLGTAYGQESRHAGRSQPAFLVGVCAHFGQGKGIPENNLALMRDAGINSLRDELGWSGVERKRGGDVIPRDQSLTFRKADQLGIAPMLIFDYANPHYDNGDRPRSPEALDGYTNYAVALVKHFGPSVRLFEVWNEYDIGIGMREPFRTGGSPADYVKMLKHVHTRLKDIDPDIQIVGGAMTGGGVNRGWLEDALKLGMLDYCDVLSVHAYNYSRPGRERTPEAWCDWMVEVQATAKRHNDGREVPMYVTEMGWPTHVGKSNSTPPELSASYLGRLYLMARTLPFVKGVWWYDYQDDGWKAEYNEDNFGLIRPDLTPKPSYYVMRDVSELVARGQCLGRLETGDPALWVVRFESDGQHIWAVWSADERPRQLLIRTTTPEQALVIQKLGHRPVERGWGHRAWASKGGGAPLIPNQAAIVVDGRPCLIHGGLDTAELVR